MIFGTPLGSESGLATLIKKTSTAPASAVVPSGSTAVPATPPIVAPPPPPAPAPKASTKVVLPPPPPPPPMPSANQPSQSIWDQPAVKYGALAALAGVVGYTLWRRSKKS
jgi:hypothetical protein